MFENLTQRQARKLWLILGEAQAQCAGMVSRDHLSQESYRQWGEIIRELMPIRIELLKVGQYA